MFSDHEGPGSCDRCKVRQGFLHGAFTIWRIHEDQVKANPLNGKPMDRLIYGSVNNSHTVLHITQFDIGPD